MKNVILVMFVIDGYIVVDEKCKSNFAFAYMRCRREIERGKPPFVMFRDRAPMRDFHRYNAGYSF